MVSNLGGPRYKCRRLLSSVLMSTVLYAAPLWARAINTPSYLKGVEATNRLSAIRVCCSFRTVYAKAALLLAGMIPLKFLVVESSDIYKTRVNEDDQSSPAQAKSDARRGSIAKWQKGWESAATGR